MPSIHKVINYIAVLVYNALQSQLSPSTVCLYIFTYVFVIHINLDVQLIISVFVDGYFIIFICFFQFYHARKTFIFPLLLLLHFNNFSVMYFHSYYYNINVSIKYIYFLL
eukprot:351884_1